MFGFVRRCASAVSTPSASAIGRFVVAHTGSLAAFQIAVASASVSERSVSRALSASRRRSLPDRRAAGSRCRTRRRRRSLLQPPPVAASYATRWSRSGRIFGISRSSSARRPGNFVMRSWSFLPIFAASPAYGTTPTAAHAALPHWPRRIAATKSRTSPTASRPVRIWPVKYARLARTGSSSSGQPHHVESPHAAPWTTWPRPAS